MTEDRGYLNERFSVAAPPLDVQRDLREKNRSPAVQRAKVPLCHECRRSLMPHRCAGHPLQATCACRSCWRTWIMDAYQEARAGARPAEALVLADGLWSCLKQTEKRNRATKDRYKRRGYPKRSRCVHCLAPITVNRAPDPRGGPFCIGKSSCRVQNKKIRRQLARIDIVADSKTAGMIARGERPDPRKDPRHAGAFKPGRPRKDPAAAAMEVDARAMEAAQPGGQLYRRLVRAEQVRAAESAPTGSPAREAELARRIPRTGHSGPSARFRPCPGRGRRPVNPAVPATADEPVRALAGARNSVRSSHANSRGT